MFQRTPWPWLMFATASLFYLYEFLLRVTPASMYAELMEAYRIEASGLGALSAVYYLSYSILQLPAGSWMDHYGPRRLLTLAALLCALGALVFSQTPSFALACWMRLLVGAGSAFAFVGCMKVLAVWFHPRWFPLLTGLTLSIGTLGAVAGEIPIAWALQWVSWRDLLWWIAVAGLPVAWFVWWSVHDKENIQPTSPTAHQRGFVATMHHVIAQPQNRWAALYGFLVTGPTDAFAGMWAVPYFVQVHGLDRPEAAAAASMTFLGMAAGSPVLGAVSSFWNNRKTPMLLGALGAFVSLSVVVLAPSLTFVEAAVCCAAFGFFGNYVLCFVVLRDNNTTDDAATAVGFGNMASMMGSMLLMGLVGGLLSVLGTPNPESALVSYDRAAYQTALLVLPLCYLLTCFLVVFALKESAPSANNRTSATHKGKMCL